MSFNASFLSKFNEICRTCLKGGQLLTYLYDEENNINLVKKLKSCTALQFDKSDQMPDKICPTCIEELLQAYNFINKCQISDATLKKYFLQESLVTKIEDDVPPYLNETVKVEVEDEDAANNEDEHFDIVSDISFKDELIDTTEQFSFVENNKKRKRDDYAAECSVDLSVKRKPSDSDNVLINAMKLNNTFSVAENKNSEDGAARPFRKTKSDVGKENVIKIKRTPKKRRNKFSCPFCNRKLATIITFLNHFLTHTETNDTTKEKLNTRLIEQIRKQNTTFQCQICWKTLNQPEQLLNHYNQHIVKYKCEFCCKIFASKNLGKHIAVKHTNPRQYKCTMCTKKLPDADALQSHKKLLHCPEKVNRCLVCSTTFDTLPELKTHCCDHVGDAPYNCQTCQNKFDDAHCLITHKLKEKCGRFYNCTGCPEIFQVIKNRNMHRTKH